MRAGLLFVFFRRCSCPRRPRGRAGGRGLILAWNARRNVMDPRKAAVFLFGVANEKKAKEAFSRAREAGAPIEEARNALLRAFHA